MKSQIKGFISGALVSALVLGGAVSALAATGCMTITVDPINIQVNGETFVPTDVNGKEVPVFAYAGTTYAPLRALAEAYGLEVGYDAEKQMATVVDPEAKTVANDDKAQEELPIDNNGKVITDFEVDFCGLYIEGEEIVSSTPKNINSGGRSYFNYELIASYITPFMPFSTELEYVALEKLAYLTYKGCHYVPARHLRDYFNLDADNCTYDPATGLHLLEGD